MGYQAVFLFCAIVLAQLDPTSGAPLSGGSVPQSGQSELVKLPRSFGVNQRVIADHGTEIYRLGEWKAVCPTRRAKPDVTLMEKVLFEERRGLSYVVRTVSGERDFSLACRLCGAVTNLGDSHIRFRGAAADNEPWMDVSLHDPVFDGGIAGRNLGRGRARVCLDGNEAPGVVRIRPPEDDAARVDQRLHVGSVRL